MRSEQEIFDELSVLCGQPGFIHAIAQLSFRDNIIHYDKEIKAEDLLRLFNRERLLRTETSTLIGLMLKQPIQLALPSAENLQQLTHKAEALLGELHDAIAAPMWKGIDPSQIANSASDLLSRGEVMREAIFYGSESAYSFQYREFSVPKYDKDDAWLRTNKGFTVHEAKSVISAIARVLDGKALSEVRSIRDTAVEKRSFLGVFTFRSSDVVSACGLNPATVEAVLAAFSAPSQERNDKFQALNDFNVATATPLIRIDKDSYALFNIYSLTESLYESPFYWMGTDSGYVSTAMHNRGQFTERFALERLKRVFGPENVYVNVEILQTKQTILAEIDVLVVFGNRVLILQAKSKRLTIGARRGNDLLIQADFKGSIQDSSDQAYRCAKLIEEGKVTLRDASGQVIVLPTHIKKIYLMCLISDHYPSLAIQARQFLQFTSSESISPPFVLDVFTLDAISEMLATPLRFLSYVDRRTSYHDRLHASHELTILSYHLKMNLWLDGEYDSVLLDDDVGTDLEIAMHVRREGIPGSPTPDGVLTRISSTSVGRLISALERSPTASTTDLGFLLLTLSEDTARAISSGIDKMAKQGAADGKPHDITVGLSGVDSGLTVHFNNDPVSVAGPRLQNHCERRKYTSHAATWYGVCIQPRDQSVRFGVNLEYKWVQNDDMDARTKNMAVPIPSSALADAVAKVGVKVGRNDPCPCGSGKKYKKCCLPLSK